MTIKTSADWNEGDKLHALYCYMKYPKQEDYLMALSYKGIYGKEGILAYKKAKKIYMALSSVFSEEELDKLTGLAI